MTDALWNLIFFVVALGLLVAIHEAGHFFAARACGVKVLRFYIGFGKAIIKRRGKDGCEYGITAIPLGGYVQMLGEMDEEDAKKYKPEDFVKYSFKHKSVAQRAFIVAAGPLANILLALVIYTIAAMHGITTMKPVVGYVEPTSIAYQSGLRQYDAIEAINDKDVPDWSALMLPLVGHMGQSVSLDVRGNIGRDELRRIDLNLESVTLTRDTDIFQALGFAPFRGLETQIIDVVMDNSPAYKAGIRKGDRLISVDGVEIKAFAQFYKIINHNPDKKSLEFIVKRDGQLYSTTVYPSSQLPDDRSLGKSARVYVGVGFKVEPYQGLFHTKEYGFFEAVLYSFAKTYQVSTFIVKSIALLVSGSIAADNISGPIGIAKGAGSSAQYGLLSFLGFLAIISVNLGIFNLLPVPVLDGGQLLFIAYEAVTKKAPGERVRYFLTMLGLGVLIALTIFSVFNDIQSLM